MSFPHTKDIDEIKFHSTEKERQNELAVKLYAHRGKLKAIADAYDEQVSGALDDLQNRGGRGAITKLKNGKKPIIELFNNLMKDCERLLLLTGKKSKVEYTNSLIVADQNNERILREAHERSHSSKPKSSKKEIATHMSKVKEINVKYEKCSEALICKKRIISPHTITRPPSKRRKIATQNSEEFVPTITVEEKNVIVHLDPGNDYELPKPSHKDYNQMYTMQEVLLYLPKYKFKGMKKLFLFLKEEGWIAFGMTKFRELLNEFEKTGKLPKENELRKKIGRPRDKEACELKEENKKVVNHCSHSDDAIDDIKKSITDKRARESGHAAKEPSTKSVLNNAFAAVVIDENVCEVNKSSLRVLSQSRSTAVRSVRTCITEIITAIETHFIPGRWHNKPAEDTLPDGCKLALRLAEDHFGCEVRPVDPRYIFNFDDTGRFHYLGKGDNENKSSHYRVASKAVDKDVRGKTSIHRSAKASDSKTSDVKTKLKYAACGEGLSTRPVIEFPIFTADQLSKPFVVLLIPGLAIGGDSSAPAGDLYGVVILSRKGGRDENGNSPSELVTEWYYCNILQKFIIGVREKDKNAKWTEGAEVPLEFRATTLVDSEQSMMSLLKRNDIEELDAKIGNICAKIAAGATGGYQPLDLAKLFGELNAAIKTSTCIGNENEIGKEFIRQIEELEACGILNFKNKQQLRHMKDIVSVVPQCYQKVCTRGVIQDAFIRAGRLSRSVKNDNVIVKCMDIHRMMKAGLIEWDKNIDRPCPKTGIIKTYNLKDYVLMQLPKILHAFKLSKKCKVTEEIMEDFGIPTDRDVNGIERLRNGTDDDYCTARSMIIHHEDNRTRMDKAIAIVKKKKLEKKINEQSKFHSYFKSNEECETILRKQAKLPDDASLGDIKEMAIFKKPKRELLLAFCKVRFTTDLTAGDKDLPTNKGNIEQEKKGLIHWAFDHRSDPVIAKEPDELVLNEEESSIPLGRDMIQNALIDLTKRNDWALNSDFIRNACIHLSSLADKGHQFAEDIHLKFDELKSCKLATRFLLPRFASLLNNHGLSEHYTIQWFERNVNQASTIVKMHGYILCDDDLDFISSSDGLFIPGLANDSNVLSDMDLSGENNIERRKQIGTYLNIDTRHHEIRRSGSTTSSFEQRMKEHAKGASLTTLESKKSRFYCAYPSKHTNSGEQDTLSQLQRGWWEDI